MKRLFLLVLTAAALFGQSPLGQFKAGGQQAVTGTAAQLPSFTSNAVCIEVIPGGSQTVYIGDSTVTTSNGFPIAAGTGLCFISQNLNKIYVVAASTGSTIAWYGLSNN